jgi:TM2 domain-containing membrane protein YozV|tara:strand:- start:4146 stop:4550 length:405 start_codon:yes stop_codon:yes gene_type:complete
MDDDTHELAIGYLLWIFGFLGAHRFYFGRPVSGTIYFFTLGLFLIGWIVDLFLMPRLEAQADRRYIAGDKNYTVAWALLTFTGVFGLHRLYMGKVFTGLLYLFTLGLFGIGLLYDYWTLNEQLSTLNTERARAL